MSLWKRIFGSPSPDGETLYKQALACFGQNNFSEAVRLLEQAAVQRPDSPAIFFTLGVTYLRAAPDGDDAAILPFAEKSVDAFKKAIALNQQFGGLNKQQVATATDAVQQWSNRSNAILANTILHLIDQHGMTDPETLLREVRALGSRNEILTALTQIESGIKSGDIKRSFLMTMTFVETIRKML